MTDERTSMLLVTSNNDGNPTSRNAPPLMLIEPTRTRLGRPTSTRFGLPAMEMPLAVCRLGKFKCWSAVSPSRLTLVAAGRRAKSTSVSIGSSARPIAAGADVSAGSPTKVSTPLPRETPVRLPIVIVLCTEVRLGNTNAVNIVWASTEIWPLMVVSDGKSIAFNPELVPNIIAPLMVSSHGAENAPMYVLPVMNIAPEVRNAGSDSSGNMPRLSIQLNVPTTSASARRSTLVYMLPLDVNMPYTRTSAGSDSRVVDVAPAKPTFPCTRASAGSEISTAMLL